jgi:CRP/FNR family transcriptional regulator, cyclic AMP receptor protein
MLLVIEKNEMLHLLHERQEFSDVFIAFMLTRNIRAEEDLIDQLFNSGEKRLARTLLLLARYGPRSAREIVAGDVGGDGGHHSSSCELLLE